MASGDLKAAVHSHIRAWRTGIFSELDAVQVAEIGAHETVTDLPKNQVVFAEAQYPKGVFYIHSGKVKIYVVGNEGKEQIIHIAREGEVIGFRAMFSGETYKVSAATLEASSIGFIERNAFTQLIDEHKPLRDAVIRELAKELGDKALFITTLAQKSVRERLAYALLLLDDIYRDGPINLSREDLANFVGTATETLIRLLRELKEDGLIHIQTRKLTILDREKLRRLAGG